MGTPHLTTQQPQQAAEHVIDSTPHLHTFYTIASVLFVVNTFDLIAI